MANTYEITGTRDANEFWLNVFQNGTLVESGVLFITKNGEGQLQSMVDTFIEDGGL